MGIISAFMGLLAPLVGTVEAPGYDAVIGGLMNWMDSWTLNLGLTVVLFVLFLKIILFPLDFISRRSMKVYQLKMERYTPQLEKLKKQYANQPDLLKQKQMAIQKKLSGGMLLGCLPQLISIGLFFWIWSAFSGYIAFTNVDTYNQLAKIYNQQVTELNIGDGETPTEEQQKIIDEKIVEGYSQMNRQFLWVKNVGIADVPWSQPIAKDAASYLGAQKDSVNINNSDYLKVMRPILVHYASEFDADGNPVLTSTGVPKSIQPNGFLILPILAIGLSVLFSFVNMRMQKKTNPVTSGTQGGVMKVMMFLMPVLYLGFALTSSSAFTIYMIMNSGISLLTTLLANVFTRNVKLKEEIIIKQGVGRR